MRISVSFPLSHRLSCSLPLFHHPSSPPAPCYPFLYPSGFVVPLHTLCFFPLDLSSFADAGSSSCNFQERLRRSRTLIGCMGAREEKNSPKSSLHVRVLGAVRGRSERESARARARIYVCVFFHPYSKQWGSNMIFQKKKRVKQAK